MKLTEEEKEDSTKKKDALDKKLAPDFVAILNAKEEFLKSRTKELPEEKVVGTHYTEEGMNRRLAIHKKNCFSENGTPVLETFFKEQGVQILKLDIETLTSEDTFKTIKTFIEKV